MLSNIRHTNCMTRKYTKHPSQNTGVRVPVDLLGAIDALAIEKECTRSEIIVAALRRQLKIPEPPPRDVLK